MHVLYGENEKGDVMRDLLALLFVIGGENGSFPAFPIQGQVS